MTESLVEPGDHPDDERSQLRSADQRQLMRDGLFRFDPGDKAPNYDHIDMIVAEFDWAIEEFGPPIEALEPAQLTALANYLEAFDETPEGEPMPSADGFRGSRIAAWFYNEDDSDDGQDADDQDEWDAEDGWDADGEDEAEAEDQADAGCEHAGEGARASGRELVEGHELGRRKAGRRAVAGLALVGALVALWGGCAWHWPSDQLWIWALAAASALTFLFISLFGGSGQASSLKHWRPDAVWLHCGDSFVSVDQQGVELWRTGPVRIVRSIPWHEISQWQLGRHHERGFTRLNQRDLEQARDRALAPPTRSQTEPPPDGRDQGEPAQDSRAEGEVRPPALRLVTETGESGYLALRPISRKDPWQAAVDLQKLADQGRRCAVSDGAAVAVAAAVPGLIGHPTSVSTETAQAGLIDPAPRRRRGTGKAGSKRRRVPLASHRFAPAAGFARWFGLGLASALALLGAKLYGHGFAVLGAGLVTVAVLPAGAAAGLSWSLRRPPPTRPAIVRLALALVLAAVGAGIVIGPAMLLDWFDASPNPRATTVLAGNGKYETTTARPGMGVGELDELDLSADPVHWVGRRVPADPPADPDRVRGLRTMIEQSVAALETQFPDAGLRLAALKSCGLMTGAEPEEPCGEVAVRRDGQYFDYTISTTRPDGAWTAEEAYSLDEDADELDHYFEVSEIDADLVARLGNLCHALEADAASADFMVRTLPLNDGGFTLIYELGCETRGGSYYFQVAGQDVVLRTQVAR